MFAVIKTGGKQYRVQEGDILDIEKIDQEEGAKVRFQEVLLIESDGKTLIGTPYVADALVSATIVESFKGEKVIVFKKKRRKQYRRTRGHRQDLTRVKIEKISLAAAKETTGQEKPSAETKGKEAVAEKPAAKKPAAEKPVAKKPAPKKTAAGPSKKPAVKKTASAQSKTSAAKKPARKASPAGAKDKKATPKEKKE